MDRFEPARPSGLIADGQTDGCSINIVMRHVGIGWRETRLQALREDVESDPPFVSLKFLLFLFFFALKKCETRSKLAQSENMVRLKIL